MPYLKLGVTVVSWIIIDCSCCLESWSWTSIINIVSYKIMILWRSIWMIKPQICTFSFCLIEIWCILCWKGFSCGGGGCGGSVSLMLYAVVWCFILSFVNRVFNWIISWNFILTYGSHEIWISSLKVPALTLLCWHF